MKNEKTLADFNEAKERTEPNYKVEDVANTPFSIVEKDGRFMVVIGNSICSEPLPTKKAALFKIKNKDWNLIGVMVSKMCAIVLNEYINKENEKLNQNHSKNNNQTNN